MYFHFFCIYLHIFAYLYIFPYFTIQASMFNFSSILHPGRPTLQAMCPGRHCPGVTGSHHPHQALSHRTHHQSLQPLPSCWKGWFQCPPLEPMGAWTRWMWWAKHTALACCSCAHRPSPSSPYQSNLEAKICRICKICILIESMQIYATWASSSLIFLKNRDNGTVVLLPCLIILWNKGEEEQHLAEPDILYS